MKLPVPFIQLPLLFDAAVLAAEINAIPESSWRPHPQGFPGNSMLPLVAVNGDPADEGFSGPMAPTEHLLRCPYLTQVIASLGATVGRSRLMRLAGQSEVTRHADQGYYWTERVRVHVPVVTQSTVRFECGDAAINMAEGECWIFDTWRQHCVLNDATASRIHLVVDTVGGAEFWDLVASGLPHDAPRTGSGWAPQRLAPQAGLMAELGCETVNVPTVMTPWEMKDHFGLLFSDALPHPYLQPVRMAAQRFTRVWQGLWFRYGERPEGHAEYRKALQAFIEEVQRAAQPLQLNNEISWFPAMMSMIGKVAVIDEHPVTQPDAARQRELGDNA
jgi:hypothetical protein